MPHYLRTSDASTGKPFISSFASVEAKHEGQTHQLTLGGLCQAHARSLGDLGIAFNADQCPLPALDL